MSTDRRRAVVYLYTQTGQLREVAEAFVRPLHDRDWQIRWVVVTPRVPFPFPWSVRRFFGVFPDAVNPRATVDLVEPADGFASAPDELVILAYQVWYLAPALPVRSLLARHPGSVRDRDVVTVIGCRNMWYSAAREMRGLLAAAGARSVSVVAATDTRAQAVTFVTTLGWLLTGRREPFAWFGRAGIGATELDRVAAVGARFAATGVCGADAAPVVAPLAAADLLAGSAFRTWSRVVRGAERHGAAARAASLVTFVAGLGAGIVVGLPAIAVASALGGARFAAAVRERVIT
ncbi:MAG TPA: hypothetical protein VIW24_11115 [Aldersonia sp.]